MGLNDHYTMERCETQLTREEVSRNTLLCREVSNYSYKTHLHVHDTTNVLPNAPGHHLALAEEISATPPTEVLLSLHTSSCS